MFNINSIIMKNLLLLFCFQLAAFIGFTQPISTFPYVEDFEAEATCPTGCGAACPTLIDWTNPITDDLDWLVDVNGTSSGGTGPSVDHTLGTTAGKYVYIETSCSGTGYPNMTAELESPWFDFTSYANVNLSFWYHAFGATQGNLNVESRVTSSGAWTAVAGPITDDVDLWQEWSGCLNGGVDSVQFRFVYVSGSSFTGDIALDDISVSALAPVDIGVTDIVGIAGCGLSTTETIEITVCNFSNPIPAGTAIPVSFSINGGTPVTETFTTSAVLAGICAGGGCENYTFTATADLSASGNYTIDAWTSYGMDMVTGNDSTSTVAISIPVYGGIPYFEDFEGGANGWTVDNSANGTWAFGTPAKAVIIGAASGDSCFVNGGLTGSYNSNEQSSVTSPCLDISTANGSEHVTMKVWWNSEFSWDGANLFSSVDGGANWTQEGSFGDPMNWYTDNTINGNPQGSGEGWTGRESSGNGSGGWVCASRALDSAMMVNNTSIQFRIGFGSDGSVQDDGFAFDDFAIGYPFAYDALADSVGVCDTSYTLDAGPGYSFYAWSTGENTQSITVNTSGTYTVTVADSMGMCASDAQIVNILNFIPPDLSDITVCAGDSALFDAGGGTGVTYSWSNMATTQTTWLYAPGPIMVTKTDPASGCTASDSANLINLSVSLADEAICDGDSLLLDASSSSSAATYLWNTTDTSPSIYVSAAGIYGVEVTDAVLGCTVSDSMLLTVNSLPVIDLGADTMICEPNTYLLDAGPGITYLWNDMSTGQTLVVSTTGTYSVWVTDANGCQGTDDVTVTFQDCSSLEELENFSIELYPNPSNGLLTVLIGSSTADNSGNIAITNVYGQLVREVEVAQNQTLFDLNDLSNGSYILSLELNNGKAVRRFILNK